MNRDRGLPLSRFFLPQSWSAPVNESHAKITRPGKRCCRERLFRIAALLWYQNEVYYPYQYGRSLPGEVRDAGVQLLKAFGEL